MFDFYIAGSLDRLGISRSQGVEDCQVAFQFLASRAVASPSATFGSARCREPRATVTVGETVAGPQITEQMTFVRDNGNWKIDILV